MRPGASVSRLNATCKPGRLRSAGGAAGRRRALRCGRPAPDDRRLVEAQAGEEAAERAPEQLVEGVERGGQRGGGLEPRVAVAAVDEVAHEGEPQRRLLARPADDLAVALELCTQRAARHV